MKNISQDIQSEGRLKPKTVFPDYNSVWEVSEWGAPSYFTSTLENER
jgi:hypothetical protein